MLWTKASISMWETSQALPISIEMTRQLEIRVNDGVIWGTFGIQVVGVINLITPMPD
jgi:hypothetical protein